MTKVRYYYQAPNSEIEEAEFDTLDEAARLAWQRMVRDIQEVGRIGIVRITDADGEVYNDDDVTNILERARTDNVRPFSKALDQLAAQYPHNTGMVSEATHRKAMSALNDAGNVTVEDLGSRYDRAAKIVQRLNSILSSLPDVVQVRCSPKTFAALSDIARDASIANASLYSDDGTAAVPPIPEVFPIPLKIDETVRYGIVEGDRRDWRGQFVSYVQVNVHALA